MPERLRLVPVLLGLIELLSNLLSPVDGERPVPELLASIFEENIEYRHNLSDNFRQKILATLYFKIALFNIMKMFTYLFHGRLTTHR